MKLHSAHIGMRTVKTTVAVMLCIIIFPLLTIISKRLPDNPAPIFRVLHFLLYRESPIFACIASIIIMQPTVEKSLKLGSSRIEGTIVGGLVGLVFTFITTLLPYKGIPFALVGIGLILIITFFNVIGSPKSTSIALVTFLIIMINIDSKDPILYAINRIIDTSIGVFIAVFINKFLNCPKCLQKLFHSRNTALKSENTVLKNEKDDDKENKNQSGKDSL